MHSLSAIAPLKGIFLFLIFFLFSLGSSRANGYHGLDAGGYVTNLNTRVTSTQSQQSEVSHFTGFLRYRRGMPLSNTFLFEPSFATLLPWFSGADGSVKTFTFHLGLNFRWDLFRFLSFRAGPGIQGDWIYARGAVVSLDNGTSTSNFYIPDGSQWVWLATVHGGVVFRLSERLSLSLDAIIQSVGNRERRRVQLASGLGWQL